MPRRFQCDQLLALVASSAALVVTSAAAQTTESATPNQVMQDISESGAKEVLSSLWQDQRVFDALLQHVERGERNWFAPWVALRRHADAAAAESIDIAFARAIPKAPDAVMSLVGNGLQLEHVCTSPFIEPETGVAEEYERSAVRALARVRDSELRPRAEACARRIRLPGRP